MTATAEPTHTGPAWPANGSGPLVFLASTAGPVEREMLEEWIEASAPGGAADGHELIDLGQPELEDRLERGDDPVLAPLSVAWLPRERHGVRQARLADLLSLRNPRRPTVPGQRRILRRSPDRGRIVLGEPASLGDLRRRREQSGGSSLAEFVRRQATLALERAERAVVGMQYKVPRLVHEEITDSARFRDGIQELAERLELAPEEAERRALEALDQMVASQSRRAIDLWGELGGYFARAYNVEVDDSRVDELLRLGRRHTLVFLPSHRSYLDPLVLRPVLLDHGLPPNHVLGGLNVSFWPIGPLTRRSGYVFIRRTFSDDEVYKWTLRQYFGYLMRKRFNLEWYIEGGRSRTGKLRPPRYGLMNYLTEAFEDGGIEDVYLVPVSIAYDELHEVDAMAEEARGAKEKRKEDLPWLIGYVRAQGSKRGSVHVAFGEPLSLKESMAATDDHRLAVQKTSFEVSHRINAVTPITASALVTLPLLGVEDRALTVGEIRSVLDPLLDYVRTRELPTAFELRLDSEEGIARALAPLCASGVVSCYESGTEPVYSIGSERHLVAAFYRNNAIHFFVERAIAELLAVTAAEKGFEDPVAEGRQESEALRDLLKFEFFFGARGQFRRALRTELMLLDEHWDEGPTDADRIEQRLAAARPRLAHRILQPFLESYLVAAEQLAARPPHLEVDEDAFVAQCLDVARQQRLRQRLASTESISSELFSTALKLADNRKLLDPGDDELRRRRQEFAAEIRTWVGRVHRVRDLALEELDEPAGSAT